MKRITVTLLIATLLFSPTQTAHGYVLPVIDAANVVQTTITAIESVLQVINSTAEVEMMIRNLKTTGGAHDDILTLMGRLNEVVAQGRALHYQLTNLSGEMHGRYPGYVNPGRWEPAYEVWTSTTLDTLRGLNVSVHEQLKPSELRRSVAITESLRTATRRAEGNLGVSQTGNFIALQQIEETRKVQQMLGAQINAQTVALSNEVNRQAAGDKVFAEWIERSQIPVVAYSGVGGFGPGSFGWRR